MKTSKSRLFRMMNFDTFRDATSEIVFVKIYFKRPWHFMNERKNTALSLELFIGYRMISDSTLCKTQLTCHDANFIDDLNSSASHQSSFYCLHYLRISVTSCIFCMKKWYVNKKKATHKTHKTQKILVAPIERM